MSEKTFAKKPDLAGEVQLILEERLLEVAEMLIFGASRREVIEMARRRFGVSQRTAQLYVQQAQKRMALEAADEDRLFHLRLSQLQRDKLVGLALRYAHDNREQLDPRVLQSLAAVITAVRGLLDSRDRAVGEIHQLVAERLQQAASLAATPPPAEETPKPATEEVVAAPSPSQPASQNGKHETHPHPTPLPQAVAERLMQTSSLEPKFNGDRELDQNGGEQRELEPACAGCAEGEAVMTT
jgi:hypothetical protein